MHKYITPEIPKGDLFSCEYKLIKIIKLFCWSKLLCADDEYLVSIRQEPVHEKNIFCTNKMQ